MGAERVLCDDVLRRRMRTCVLSVSSTVGRLIPALRLGIKVPRQKKKYTEDFRMVEGVSAKSQSLHY